MRAAIDARAARDGWPALHARARARRSRDGGAARAHRCAAHPARARSARARRASRCRRCRAGARVGRRRSGPSSAVALAAARPRARCTRRSRSASTRCSTPGSSTRCARCARAIALTPRHAVDALRRLSAGVGIPRRRDRRGDAARHAASPRRASSRSGSSRGCARLPARGLRSGATTGAVAASRCAAVRRRACADERCAGCGAIGAVQTPLR